MSAYPTLDLALPVLAGTLLIGLAALVAKTGWTHPHNRVYAALYVLSGLKSVSDGLLSANAAGVSWADAFHAEAPLFPPWLHWVRIQAVCAFFMTPLLLHFVLVFPRPWRRLGSTRLRRWLPLLYLPSAVLAVLFLAATPHWEQGVLLHAGTLQYLYLFEAAAVVATVLAVVRVARAWRHSGAAVERKQALYLLVAFLPSFVVSWTLAANDLTQQWAPALASPLLARIAGTTLITLLSPVLEAAAAVVVAYAILKYRLMGVELRLKGGIKYLVMTTIMGTVLFVLNTYVGNFILQDKVFSFAGHAGSSVLGGIFTVLIFNPVESLASKVTDRLFPDTTKDPEAYARARARDIYRAQATYVLQDATVTDRELAFLHELRSQLGLADAEARTIEDSVERRLGVDSARTGTPSL